MRFNYRSHRDEDGLPAPHPDDIYYIKWSKPHLEQAAIVGPCYETEQIMTHLLLLLRRHKSVQGEETLDEIIFGGGDGALFHRLEHFNAVLPDGHIMKVEIIRERNAEVASALPGDVYGVLIATVSTALIRNMDENASPPREKDMEVYATFKKLEEANQAAEEVLRGLSSQAGRGSEVERLDVEGRFAGFIFVPGSTETKMVEVKLSRVEPLTDPPELGSLSA